LEATKESVFELYILLRADKIGTIEDGGYIFLRKKAGKMYETLVVIE